MVKNIDSASEKEGENVKYPSSMGWNFHSMAEFSSREEECICSVIYTNYVHGEHLDQVNVGWKRKLGKKIVGKEKGRKKDNLHNL